MQDHMQENSSFIAERDSAYAQLLDAIGRHESALPAMLITDIRALAPAAAKSGAAREAWGLYAAGIAHLRAGAPGGAPGGFGEALARVSIRNASLAAGLGIAPPLYAETGLLGRPLQASGLQEAIFVCRRLVEAAEADLALSRRQIAQGLALHNPADAFGAQSPTAHDPELEKIARAAQLRADSGIADADLAAMRKQLVLCFNFLVEAYQDAGRSLRADIDALS